MRGALFKTKFRTYIRRKPWHFVYKSRQTKKKGKSLKYKRAYYDKKVYRSQTRNAFVWSDTNPYDITGNGPVPLAANDFANERSPAGNEYVNSPNPRHWMVIPKDTLVIVYNKFAWYDASFDTAGEQMVKDGWSRGYHMAMCRPIFNKEALAEYFVGPQAKNLSNKILQMQLAIQQIKTSGEIDSEAATKFIKMAEQMKIVPNEYFGLAGVTNLSSPPKNPLYIPATGLELVGGQVASGEVQEIKSAGYSAPHFTDIDRDNKSDLLIGDEQGNLRYWINGGPSIKKEENQETKQILVENIDSLKCDEEFFNTVEAVIKDDNGQGWDIPLTMIRTGV